MTAADVIQLLDLQPHPVEGGFFRETWRGGGSTTTATGRRDVGTSIYYLLSGPAVSEMHKLPGDEVFHFYLGDPVRMLQLHPGGKTIELTLGPDLAAGQVPQVVVSGGVWQGSRRIADAHGFSLLGATMAPGFDYADYVTGGRAELVAGWPGWDEVLAVLTPKG